MIHEAHFCTFVEVRLRALKQESAASRTASGAHVPYGQSQHRRLPPHLSAGFGSDSSWALELTTPRGGLPIPGLHVSHVWAQDPSRPPGLLPFCPRFFRRRPQFDAPRASFRYGPCALRHSRDRPVGVGLDLHQNAKRVAPSSRLLQLHAG